MAKKPEEVIVSVIPVSINKDFIQPVAITEDFVTFPCFKYVEVKRVVVTGKNKTDLKKDMDRYPLMLAYDGKTVKWAVAHKAQEIEIKSKDYIIDRYIDDNPTLPSEKFVAKLMDEFQCKRMIANFRPEHLFQEIYEYWERYFYFEKDYLYVMTTLFAANIWVFDAHDSTPYLFVRSPIPGCGKTNLGVSIANMCNGLMIVSPNVVHIFRLSHGTKTTLVFDEIKRLTSPSMKLSQDDKDILSLINTGFQKYGSKTPRAVEVTIGGVKTYKIELYDGYNPKVLITTDGVLPPDTSSRCIDLRMQKAPPRGKPYDERWTEKERLERLNKIREMGLLFRFKYGREIKRICQDQDWRKKLDKLNLFDGIHNRYLEIFRPLIILSLKYIPDWNDSVNVYIRKYIEMKAEFEPTLVHNILWALRVIYNDVVNNEFKIIEDQKFGTISLETDEIHGTVLLVPPKYIADRIDQMTAIGMYGRNPASTIGKKLDELGFMTGDKKKRTGRGIIRTIKIKQLEDMCERYLGVGLKEDDDGTILPQKDQIALIRKLLIDSKNGLTYVELNERTDGKITDGQMKAMIKHFRERGEVVKTGKAFVWIGV